MLKPNSRLILKAIIDQCPPEGARLRMAEIAEAAHCSGRTVRRHIRRLNAWGYISLQLPYNGTAYYFQIQPKAQEELN